MQQFPRAFGSIFRGKRSFFVTRRIAQVTEPFQFRTMALVATKPTSTDKAGEPINQNPHNYPGIDAVPTENQNLHYDGVDYKTIREGLAFILIPASASSEPSTKPTGENESQSVFYNPIQQFNRDLSVLAIKAYGEQVLSQRAARTGTLRKNKKRKRETRDVDGDEAAKSNGEKQNGAVQDPAEVHGIGEKTKNSEAPEGSETVEADGAPVAEKAVPEDSDMVDSEQNIVSETVDSLGPAIVNADKPNSRPPRPFKILDALSATGLRALRYAHEIPFTTSVTANDLLKEATKSIEINVKHNKLSEKIRSVTGNALSHMYSVAAEKTVEKKKMENPLYDVIDLDPYGTAAPFLDAAVQSVADGGLLCVTCTDAAVWASNSYPEKAYSLYGGIPVKGLHSHEAGLRLILHAIATSAARYGLAIEPLLSLSIDFYGRVFVRIHKSPADVKFLAGKTMMIYNCDQGCGAWTTQMIGRNKLLKNKNGSGTFYKHMFELGPSAPENCEHCGSKPHLAGPMYAGPIHQRYFVQKILDDLAKVSKDTYKTTARIEGMLTTALEETISPIEPLTDLTPPPRKPNTYDPAEIDHYPFFFIPSILSKVIHAVTPNEDALRGALRHLGYRVTRSHCKPGAIKTDAPWSVVWEVMREWTRQKAPIKEGSLRPGMAGYKIMGMDKPDGGEADGSERLKVVFDERLGREKDAKKLVRYQMNPRENWGPMNRAKGPV